MGCISHLQAAAQDGREQLECASSAMLGHNAAQTRGCAQHGVNHCLPST